MRHGLVIGKFYPPHLGHHHLIATAAAHVDRLSVLVLGSRRESIPVADRVSWLSEIHPDPHIDVIGGPCDVPIDLDSDPIWSAHVAIMRATLESRTSQPVNVVFSSEPYGRELACRFRATHVAVDPARATQAVSSTVVRHDLSGSWDLLHPVVRAGLTTRVVVLGAESTGTTTVSQGLAETYRAQGDVWERTQVVPEYGRDHTVLKHEAACAEAVRRGRPARDSKR